MNAALRRYAPPNVRIPTLERTPSHEASRPQTPTPGHRPLASKPQPWVCIIPMLEPGPQPPGGRDTGNSYLVYLGPLVQMATLRVFSNI